MLNNIPNKLTRETIEKALKDIDVETVDGVAGLFENLDKTMDIECIGLKAINKSEKIKGERK